MMYHDKQLENIVSIHPTSQRSFSQWQGDNNAHRLLLSTDILLISCIRGDSSG